MKITSYNTDEYGSESVTIIHYNKIQRRPVYLKNGIPHISFNGKEKALKDIKETKGCYHYIGGF